MSKSLYEHDEALIMQLSELAGSIFSNLNRPLFPP